MNYKLRTMSFGNFARIVLCIVYSSSFIVAPAQNRKIDSLYNIVKAAKDDTGKIKNIVKLERELTAMAQFKKADSLAARLKELSQKLNDTLGIVAFYKITGTLSYAQGNYTNALKNYIEALKLDEKIGQEREIASICANIGSIYYSQGNYPQALENYLRALREAEKLNNEKGKCNAYVNIGIVYEAQANYTEALKYYNLAVTAYEKDSDKDGMANVYGNLGNVYQEQGNFDEALKVQLKSLKLCKEIGYNLGMGIAYVNIGDAYEAKKDYNNALDAYTNALKILESVKHKRGMGYAYTGLGSVNTHLKKYALAKLYLDSALNVSQEIGAKEVIKEAYGCRTTLDSAVGDYKAALEDYKGYIRFSDSLKNEDNVRKLVSEQMQYDFDKKQNEEKAEQDKKDAITEADKHKQQIITSSVSIGLLLVLVFSVLLFSRFRITQQQKKVIEQQKALVETKNKEVLDSITYAKRLQDAILPPMSVIKKYLPESFVLYKPKDIVAGDFYWMETAHPQPLPVGREKNSTTQVLPIGEDLGGAVLIAACDCTGHGVPGAMVSVVCSNALNRAVKEFKITEPGKILDKVQQLVVETFEKSEGDIKDGMDISLLSISAPSQPSPLGKEIKLQFAGAYNSLLILGSSVKRISPTGGEKEGADVIELVGDKQPIGKSDNPKPFTTHSITLPIGEGQGGALYLFTDGYADQFGGPDGKKFMYKKFNEKIKEICEKPMEEQKQILDKAFAEWKGDLEQVDDVLVIGIRV